MRSFGRMCGIFGVVSRTGLGPDQIERARHARDRLSHRGPDQEGEWIAGGVYLGHRRLSILDLSESGRQPMVSDDGDVAVAVNGEIYNHLDLRRRLGESSFRSGSDSEVVLHGYRAWGIDGLVERLDGMYAFVVHDRARTEIHMVRDRVGIKPLYYGWLGEGVVWASELKAIVDFAGGGLTLDTTAAYDALTYGYVPAPKSIFRGISKLEAGSVATLRCDELSVTVRRYWSLPVHERPVDDVTAGEQLRSLIDVAVDGHLMADVPVGFFLSGGIDSSIVVSHAARHHPDPVAYSIGYDDADHDETRYAMIVAGHLGVRHVVEVLGAGSSVGALDRMVEWYDEPFADTSALPTHHVSRLARESSVVALTGDGGDELFAGYRWYNRFAHIRSAQRWLGPAKRWVRPTSLSSGGPATNRLARMRSGADQVSRTDALALYAHLLGDRLPRAVKRRWRRELEIDDDYDDHWSFRRYDEPDLPLPKRLQVLDFHTYLPDDILTKVDRASMAVSLEARVPLLATPVVEHAFSLPHDFHLRDGQQKGGLKAAYIEELPPSIVERPKRGFSVPLGTWHESVVDSGYHNVAEAMVGRFTGAGRRGTPL